MSNESNPIIDICFQLNTDNDRKSLINLSRNPSLGKDVHAFYIYSLVDESVNYPNKAGKIVYIGETCKSSTTTGRRFGNHISTEENVGSVSESIYALSRYYWQGKKLRLRIFLANDLAGRKEKERKLFEAHVKEYGALPICQGTVGDNYRTTYLASLNRAEELLVLTPAE